MSSIFIIVLVVFALMALVMMAGKKARGVGSHIGFPYVPAKALFSAAERSFLGVLDQAAGPDCRVFGKVRVADLASVKPGLSNAARQGALNRIGSKHFDFVVCRASDLSVLCVVELNDRSHQGKRAQSRDAVKRGVCEAIGLPLFQVPARRSYVVHELRQQLSSALDTLSTDAVEMNALSDLSGLRAER